MRLYGLGPFHRELKLASKIQKKSHFVIRKNDVIYNKLFAWKGTFGIVSGELDGMFVSDKFPTYELNEKLVDRDFLRWYFRYPPLWEQARQMSIGSAALSKLTLNPPKFMELTIPLPPLSEQRRIVAKIELLAAKIDEATPLKQESTSLTSLLTKSSSSQVFHGKECSVGEVSNVTKLAGFEYTKYFTNAGPGPIRVVRAGNVRNSGLDLSNAMTIPSEVSNALPRSQLQAGDVVMTFIGAKIGDVTHILSAHGRLHCGPNVARITPSAALDTEYLERMLQAPYVQDQILEITKSTAQPSLSMKTIRELRVLLPSREEQRRIVAYLDGLQAKVDQVKRLQAESAAELDALLPAILDRAFKGEL
jgi:type I restriction enzyme S subunit